MNTLTESELELLQAELAAWKELQTMVEVGIDPYNQVYLCIAINYHLPETPLKVKMRMLESLRKAQGVSKLTGTTIAFCSNEERLAWLRNTISNLEKQLNENRT